MTEKTIYIAFDGKEFEDYSECERYESKELENKYGKDFLERVWSNRNKNSPFELAVNSNKKVIWKCGDSLHKEYLRSCDKSVRYEFRCPECVKRRKESLIQEKTRIYLEMLGYTPLTEYKCTISPINPKTNHHMLYDNEIILSLKKDKSTLVLNIPFILLIGIFLLFFA